MAELKIKTNNIETELYCRKKICHTLSNEMRRADANGDEITCQNFVIPGRMSSDNVQRIFGLYPHFLFSSALWQNCSTVRHSQF